MGDKRAVILMGKGDVIERNFSILRSVIEMKVGSSSQYNRGSQGIISGMSQQGKEGHKHRPSLSDAEAHSDVHSMNNQHMMLITPAEKTKTEMWEIAQRQAA